MEFQAEKRLALFRRSRGLDFDDHASMALTGD